jgi:hypothetical protein
MTQWETSLSSAKATAQPVIVLPKWAWGAAVLLLFIGIWGAYLGLLPKACPVHEVAESHQDGNDRFYVLAHSAMGKVKPHPNIGFISHYREIEVEHEEESARKVDAHFLVSIDVLPRLQEIVGRRGLAVIREVEIRGHRFALLSSEIYGQQSDAADGYRRG